MNAKKLLFTLFVLYWIMVYGVSFFASKGTKERYRNFFPTGYRMYTPATNTHYEVDYTFYKEGEAVEELRFSEFMRREKEKGRLLKTRFVEDRLFSGFLKTLDHHYQMELFTEKVKKGENRFETLTREHPELQMIIGGVENFAKYYISVNPDLRADSVHIKVSRAPMILPFDPEYKGNFTYYAGEGVFYETGLNLTP